MSSAARRPRMYTTAVARIHLKLADNVPGELYVDSTCIDCQLCRELAPEHFGDSTTGQASVVRQPASAEEWQRALGAQVACPTASIGSDHAAGAAAARFPAPLDGPVFWSGYADRASYGAHSYFVRRADGNLLVDTPRPARPLLRQLDAMGGVKRLFLTHRDDVGDHAAFRSRYGCERILHRDDVDTGTEGVEQQPEGTAPRALGEGLLLIPVPGHTRGSCALLVDAKYLFTGDHLWAGPGGRLEMGRELCWYSWDEQQRSLWRLLDFDFEWVLPSHGRSLHLPAPQMRAALRMASLQR